MSWVYAILRGGVTKPRRKHEDDAGVDVYASKTVVIWPFSMGKVPTGITAEIERGHALLVWPKSGGDHLIGAGVIDAGYQGEILVKIANYRPWPIVIKQGQPLAQLVKVPVVTDLVVEVPLNNMHLARTARGQSGGINC